MRTSLCGARWLLLTVTAAAALTACNKAPDATPQTDANTAPVAQLAPAPTGPATTSPTNARTTGRHRVLTANEPAAAPAQSGPLPPELIYRDYRPSESQPAAVAVPWAPPPMLAEAIPPQPSSDVYWTGGYWAWQGQWLWVPGQWARPPRPHEHWQAPYYEHRQDRVIFVDGHWSPPGASFVPPRQDLAIALAVIAAGVAIGHVAQGPQGVFLPPPPGSHHGLIVPAPVGTSPAIMLRAPAIFAPGMRVTHNERIVNEHNTTVINNLNTVTIQAPAAATASHQAVNRAVPAAPHLAAVAPGRADVHAAVVEPPAARHDARLQPGTAGAVRANEMNKVDHAHGAPTLGATLRQAEPLVAMTHGRPPPMVETRPTAEPMAHLSPHAQTAPAPHAVATMPHPASPAPPAASHGPDHAAARAPELPAAQQAHPAPVGNAEQRSPGQRPEVHAAHAGSAGSAGSARPTPSEHHMAQPQQRDAAKKQEKDEAPR